MRANRREPVSVPFWFQSMKNREQCSLLQSRTRPGRPHGGLLQSRTRPGRPHGGLLQGFEAVFAGVFAYFLRVPDFAVHDNIGARRQALRCSDGAADIEYGIGIPESGRVQGAGQHNGLVFNVIQNGRCFDH